MDELSVRLEKERTVPEMSGCEYAADETRQGRRQSSRICLFELRVAVVGKYAGGII